MTQELFDLATSHTFTEEAVQEIFCKYKGKAQAEPMDEARDSTRQGKGKKDNWRRRDIEFIATVDRIHKQKTGKLNHVNFNKIIKMPCCNHSYPVKHTLEECNLIKPLFKGDYKTIDQDASSRSANNEGKRDAYPDPKGCLMIFGRPATYESRHQQRLTAREVNADTLGKAALDFLKWLEIVITFDTKDHLDHTFHSLGASPLSSTRSSARPT
jgi:hypothetical protein